jgi:tRNA-Thr(GGU) m(6)t(6)A37 methyltransferase TsaA
MAALLHPVGYVRSTLKSIGEAPRQGIEGAPDAWLEIDERYEAALRGLAVGEDIMLITWLDRAERDVLEVHPRGDARAPLTGVFATRSPHRPNPLGLHRVTVRELAGRRLLVGPLEAIDGTPVMDIKAVLSPRGDS